MANSKEIKELINDNRQLFWYSNESDKENIGEDQLVETILNYGDVDAVKHLINILGIEKVADLFYRHTHSSKRRKNNYPELIFNFFDLYFKRHAKNYPVK